MCWDIVLGPCAETLCWDTGCDIELRHWLWFHLQEPVAGADKLVLRLNKACSCVNSFFANQFSFFYFIWHPRYPGGDILSILLRHMFDKDLLAILFPSFSSLCHGILLHILLQECDTHDTDPLGVGRPSPFPPKVWKFWGWELTFCSCKSRQRHGLCKSECQCVKIQSVFDTGTYRTQVWNVLFDYGSPKVYGNQSILLHWRLFAFSIDAWQWLKGCF